jgi:hypothetical protein
MFLNIILFISGMIVGPVVLLLIAARFRKKKAPAAAPLKPTREELISCVEHLRDRLRAIEGSSGQKVITELAKRAQMTAEETLKGDIHDG